MNHPKVLIVGTVPYNKDMTSRAFDAYFHNWEKDNIYQVFSNNNIPAKGHCGELYQITDKRLLQKRFNKKMKVEKIYKYENLQESVLIDNNQTIYNKMYSIGHNKTPLIYLLRGLLWRKKYWCTEAFDNWIDKFKPECVFLSFSDDFFIPRIALYVAERFNIPIISSIGDDYYFNGHFSLSPFYYIYRFFYKKLIRKILLRKGNSIYISDKIKAKYNNQFNLKGETIYLTSEIKRKNFKPINKQKPVISYFGNISLGRNHLLNDIGDALKKINNNYYLNVYSNETEKKYTRILEGNSNINYYGKIPYKTVKKKICESDIIIIVEGYSKKDIITTKYSLSTKAADSLSSGTNIFSYGSMECGIIEYMKSTNASVICTNKKDLCKKIKSLIEDENLQRQLYHQARDIYVKNHTLSSSNAKFENIVKNTIKEYDNCVE